jgi:uncharacterized Rmd1/YagE family protein
MQARAWLLGRRIDVRALEERGRVGTSPLTLRVGRAGRAVVFRFGAVVGFGLDDLEARGLLDSLQLLVQDPLASPQSETCEVVVDPQRPEGVEADGTIVLHDDSVPRLQVVAHALAKSEALSYQETRATTAFERVEALAERLGQTGGPNRRGSQELQREISSALRVQGEIVGRLEVAEKPEIAWDRPDLDKLYERLAREYELAERDRALTRKLDLQASTAGTYLDLIHARQNLRLELYIVLLIVLEIALNLIERVW